MIRRDIDIPLYRQVYNLIREQIITGVLAESDPIASSRKMAKQLNVSRNVVLEAYDQLLAEGYIESRQGSYTRVTKGLKVLERSPKETDVVRNKLVDYTDLIDFKTGVPDANYFPRVVWGKLLKKACMELTDAQLGYSEPEGNYELRATIRDYLFRTRSINVKPEEIIITSGATQGLAIVARMLYEKDAEVILEEPSSLGTQKIIKYAGYKSVPNNTDHEGLITSELSINKNTKMIYTTPSHQFPMGGILSIKRRLDLLKIVQDKACYIIEDDYDGEFRYDGYPITPMRAINETNVIYLGSFSKVLSPALRLGYIVLPKPLIKKFKLYKLFDDVHTGTIDQLALNYFIKEGHFEKHIYKMNQLYKKKRNTLVESLESYFGDTIDIHGNNSGLHLVVDFKNKNLENVFKNLYEKKQVKLHSVENHAIVKGSFNNFVVFGYGHLSIEEIKSGVKTLYDQMESSNL